MNPGTLDRVIKIQNMVIAKDAMGGQDKTPQTYLDTRARVIYSKGTEKIDAAKETATSIVIFRIRYFAGIKQTMQVVYDTEIYNIKGINEWGGRKAYLDLFTEKRE